jgi:hypothetical protein
MITDDKIIELYNSARSIKTIARIAAVSTDKIRRCVELFIADGRLVRRGRHHALLGRKTSLEGFGEKLKAQRAEAEKKRKNLREQRRVTDDGAQWDH